MTPVFSVRHLSDVPELLPVLKKWFVDEWNPYYGPDGPGDAESDLRAASSPGRLPLCLVAIDCGTPVGTVSLRMESVPSHRHLAPWVAATFVRPDRRRQGIYTTLLAAVEEEARRNGFERLYIASDAATHLLERRGWRRIDEAATLRQTVDVFELDLRAS